MSQIQCLDIGNTSTKLGIFQGEKLSDIIVVETTKLIKDPNSILSKIKEENGPLSYCSVVPKAEDSLLNGLTNFAGCIHSVSSDSRANLPVSYPTPNEIGADRIANAIAVFNTLTLPAVVIDQGTATTFDIVTPNSGYEGGVILPGPQGFLDYLSHATALLPHISLPKSFVISSSYGKSTKDAMLIGVFLGYNQMIQGMIEKLNFELSERFNQRIKFVISGGSPLKLDLDGCIQRENLTLEGLKIAFEFNL